MGTELGKGLEHQGQLRGVSLEKGGSGGTLFCTTPCQEGAAKAAQALLPLNKRKQLPAAPQGV